MNTSENISELAAALAKAQAEMKNAIAGADNPFFKSKYAELSVVRDAVTPALTKNGIAVTQLTDIGEGCLVVCTRLIHSSGQWIESRYPITNDVNKPQAMGSAMTYARRYSLSAICGISSEKDDDGNAAQDHGKTAPAPVMIASNGTPGASKAPSRAPYDRMVKEIRDAKGVKALQDWYAHSFAEIEKLPPDFVDELRIEYTDKLSELKKGLAA